MEWPVAPVLRPYVASIWAYDADLGEPGTHIGMPSTSLTLVLPVGEPLDVAWADRPESRGRRWSSASGLHARPAVIHHDGHQQGVQMALTTTGSRALLGLPAAALAGELVTLEDLGPRLRHLPERLASETSWLERLRIVERALVAALARSGAPRPRAEVGRALARLTRGASVADVADEVGYSRRHLGSLVRAECGLGPKEYQRLARFERSRDLLFASSAGGTASLSAVAADAGYADQAHLTREWQGFAGCTPTQWLREEFPFLQDEDPVGGAGWGHE